MSAEPKENESQMGLGEMTMMSRRQLAAMTIERGKAWRRMSVLAVISAVGGGARAWLHRVLRFGGQEDSSSPLDSAPVESLEPTIPSRALEGTPSDRLLAWLLAGLEESRRENLDGGMLRSRAERLFRAAIAAWSEEDAERSASGFCDWVGRVEHLAAWLADREGRAQSEAAKEVRAYLTMLPGYQFGQAPAEAAVLHAYLTMQFSGAGGAVARYLERCCDDPGAVRALAMAGFEPLRRPSEDSAFEGLTFLEKEEIERSIEPAASEGKLGQAHRL